MINKLLILGPATILLGYFAPWAITPILMFGGAYLCFEGYEKVHSIFVHHEDDNDGKNDDNLATMTPEELEKERISGAVTTDLILSAEIMAITYGTVLDKDIVSQIIVMLCVAIGITVAVYGVVGIIVKVDDVGLHMAKDKYHPAIRKFGRGLILSMPYFLSVLGYIGTAAMLWVGAEIIIHGIAPVHHALEALLHTFESMPFVAWLVKVIICAVGGTILGGIVAALLVPAQKIYKRFKPVKA